MSPRPAHRPTAASRPLARNRPDRRPLVLGIAVAAVVVVAAIGLAIGLSGEDGSGDDPVLDATFGPVEVSGPALPTLTSPAADPALGTAAPEVDATTPEGDPIDFGGPGEPTLVVFLAHWCPHCQAELPVLVDLAADGGFEGVRTVAVLTGTDPVAPNFPPVRWLDREGWTGEIALDDERGTAAAAYGLSSYPFLVMLDADGQVVGRTSGEQPQAVVAALVDAGR